MTSRCAAGGYGAMRAAGRVGAFACGAHAVCDQVHSGAPRSGSACLADARAWAAPPLPQYEPSRQSIVALIDASPEMLRLAPEPMEEVRCGAAHARGLEARPFQATQHWRRLLADLWLEGHTCCRCPARHQHVTLGRATPTSAPRTQDEDDEGGGGAGGARSYLAVAVDAVVRLMKWRIMHAPNDDIGVMFYGAVSAGSGR